MRLLLKLDMSEFWCMRSCLRWRRCSHGQPWAERLMFRAKAPKWQKIQFPANFSASASPNGQSEKNSLQCKHSHLKVLFWQARKEALVSEGVLLHDTALPVRERRNSLCVVFLRAWAAVGVLRSVLKQVVSLKVQVCYGLSGKNREGCSSGRIFLLAYYILSSAPTTLSPAPSLALGGNLMTPLLPCFSLWHLPHLRAFH